jgi:hypothetical protein
MGRRVVVGLAVTVAVAACAVAAVVVGKRVKSRRKWRRVVGVLAELEQGCETTVARLKQVVDAMAVEMHAGLASEGGSKLKMLLTFVDTLPNGYSLFQFPHLGFLLSAFSFMGFCLFQPYVCNSNFGFFFLVST